MIPKLFAETVLFQVKISMANYKLGLAVLNVWKPLWWQKADEKRFQEDMVAGAHDKNQPWNNYIN